MQGTLQPGVLPKLLGELYVGGKSGLLHVARGDQSVDVDLRDGQIAGGRGLHDCEALFETLSWDEGVYSFEEGRVTPGGEQPVPDLSMPELIREGVHRLEDTDVVCYALGDLDRVLVVGGAVGRWMACAPSDDVVLSRVDGTRSVREVIELVPLPAEETQRTILGLLYTGALESVPLTPEPDPGAATTDLEEAAAPSREAWEGRGRFYALEHLEALGIPRGVLPEDPVENALLADDVIRKATHLMADSDNWSAMQLLEAVIPAIHAKELKHEAQVVLARACSRNPKWVKRGEDMLLAVVREDPACLVAYFELGILYKHIGLKARALAMFRKVSELKPGHAHAAAEIRSLNMPPPHGRFFKT